jgi:Baseplate J-like protein
MYQVEDEPIETIHLYVVREGVKRPSLIPVIISVFALSILIAIGVFTPYQQPVQRVSIRVPAVPLGMRSFTTSVAIVPTGIKAYPATTAHGLLTITNGSIIGQTIPAGLTVQNVATDRQVYVPPGNANGYGYATVPAHALMSGSAGNIPAYAINRVEGSSVYIRNLSAFSGGRDAYSVKFVTAQDEQTAFVKARGVVALQVNGLHYPCEESYLQNGLVNTVTWRCQFVTYHISASYHVTGVRISGKNLIIDVIFIAHPVYIWVK